MILIKRDGFVLPFTLLICAIMLLISVSISATLTKQIYFSNLARESQAAYYAADTAVACTLAIDETYADQDGIGIFPYSSTTPVVSNDDKQDMIATLASTTESRSIVGYSPLATSLGTIECAQSSMFDTASAFTISNKVFSHTFPAHDGVDVAIENGRTSTFNMKMDLGGSLYRCAKVTVNKTKSYRQVIAQGYSKCGTQQKDAVERAVVNTTITQ